MKFPLPALASAAIAMIALTMSYLSRMKEHHRLLPPGVRVVGVPVLNEDGEIARTNSVYLPSNIPGWRANTRPIQRIELDYLPRDTTYARMRYDSVSDRFTAQASCVLMGSDRTSIHRPEYCLTGQGWGIVGRSFATIRIPKPHPYDLTVRRFDTAAVATVNGKSGTIKGIYLFWFVADNLLTADHRERMWWMARDLLRDGVLQRWAYVSYFAECRPGEEEATFQHLCKLIQATVPEFQLTVPPAEVN